MTGMALIITQLTELSNCLTLTELTYIIDYVSIFFNTQYIERNHMYKSLVLLSFMSLSVNACKPQESEPVTPREQRMSGMTRTAALAGTVAAGFALCPTTIVAGPGATAGCAAKFATLFGAILTVDTIRELYVQKNTPITK